VDAVALMIFLECQSQWNYVAPFGGALIRTGLSYSNVRVVCESHGFELSSHLLARIQILESWQINLDNEKRESTAAAMTEYHEDEAVN
jgi:hypothetical protein